MNHKPAPWSASNGAYLQGHIDITYGELTAHFGEPILEPATATRSTGGAPE